MNEVERIIIEAVRYHQAGRLEEASRGYRRALELDANQPDALHLLGVIEHQRGNHAAAIGLIDRAIALRPKAAEFYVNGASALQSLGRKKQAIAYLERAVQLAPNLVEAHSNLGGALAEAGELKQAIEHFQRALSLRPGHEAARLGLAGALARENRVSEAIACLRETIGMHARSAAARVNLANLLRQERNADEAMNLLREAIALDPRMPQAYHNLGTALFELGLLAEAREAYKSALALRPGDPLAEENYLLTLYRDSDTTAEEILEAHRQWGVRFADSLTAAATPIRADRDSNRVLRVGYVGSSFNNNPPAQRFLVPLFRNHDRGQFEVSVYSDVVVEDETTRMLRGFCNRWRVSAGMTDAELAEVIRADKIDVLVDLSLHAGGNRLLALARRAAPVQITYLAYAGTSGMKAMDWRVSDWFLDPAGFERFYSEKSLRVESYWGYEPPGEAPEVGPLPMRERGYVTFGSLNQFSKVQPATVSAWAKVLKKIRGSRLILRCDEGSPRARMLEMFAAHGVEPGRIDFVAAQTFGKYLETYGRMDIALDPFPCAGGTTTCDALWMGVPVVTLAGGFAVARAGVSVLSNVGMPEMIAKTTEEYVGMAVNLASDPSRLEAIRGRLRQEMAGSRLCNVRRFAEDIEDAYRRTWRAWCAS